MVDVDHQQQRRLAPRAHAVDLARSAISNRRRFRQAGERVAARPVRNSASTTACSQARVIAARSSSRPDCCRSCSALSRCSPAEGPGGWAGHASREESCGAAPKAPDQSSSGPGESGANWAAIGRQLSRRTRRGPPPVGRRKRACRSDSRSNRAVGQARVRSPREQSLAARPARAARRSPSAVGHGALLKRPSQAILQAQRVEHELDSGARPAHPRPPAPPPVQPAPDRRSA